MTPRPPVRALALAAVLAIAGAASIVAPVGGVWGTVLVVLGVVLLGFALALGVLAFAAPRRQQVVIRVDDEGYRVDAPGGVRQQGDWAAVTRVTATPGRLTLHRGDDRRRARDGEHGSKGQRAHGRAWGHHELIGSHAARVGFEPTEGLPSAAFKAAALGHYAISPEWDHPNQGRRTSPLG